jgi:hypothetical protein
MGWSMVDQTVGELDQVREPRTQVAFVVEPADLLGRLNLADLA